MNSASKFSFLILILISAACIQKDKQVSLQTSSPDTAQKIIQATSIIGQWQLSNPVCKWDLKVNDNGTYILDGRNYPWCGNDRNRKTFSSGNWYEKDNYYFLSSSEEIKKLHAMKAKSENDKDKKEVDLSRIDTLYWTFDKTKFMLEKDSLFMLDSKNVKDTFIVFALKR